MILILHQVLQYIAPLGMHPVQMVLERLNRPIDESKGIQHT